MTKPLIHGKRPIFSASSVLGAIGSELALIKAQDGLTHNDMARVIGKSPDQVAKYIDGAAEMGVVAFAAATREWGGRFTGALDRLCEESRPVVATDRQYGNRVLQAAAALNDALEDDNQIDADEVRANRRALEAAREAIDALLAKAALRAVS